MEPTRTRWLTSSLPGTGGSFTTSVEDFAVEELPLYEACGDGEHLYVRFEKRGLSTRDVVRRAIERLRLPEPEVGYAGLKDKHARTVQTISLPRVSEADAKAIEGDGVVILSAVRHKNKLRVGHLAGNRFEMVIRPEPGAAFDEAAAGRARAVLELLASAGFPNFFGAQRFGIDGGNVDAGREALRRGGRGMPHWKAKFAISALQSALFNDVLLRRMESGQFSTVLAGDVLQKVGSGGIFPCAEPAVDQLRFDAFEISVTGPIFGAEMRAAEGVPGEHEAAVLAAGGLSVEDFKKAHKLAPGTRRQLRAPVKDASVRLDSGNLVVSFQLPSGSYATVLIDELVKPARPLEEE